MDSWAWIPRFGVLGLDSWIWTPGLNLTDGCAETYDSGPVLQILGSPPRSIFTSWGNPARKPVSFYKPFISWRAHCKLHSGGRVDWGRLRESPLILHTRQFE